MSTLATFLYRRVFTFTAVAMPLWAVSLVFFRGDFSLLLFWLLYGFTELGQAIIALRDNPLSGYLNISYGHAPAEIIPETPPSPTPPKPKAKPKTKAEPKPKAKPKTKPTAASKPTPNTPKKQKK